MDNVSLLNIRGAFGDFSARRESVDLRQQKERYSEDPIADRFDQEKEKMCLVVDHVSSLNLKDVSGNLSAKRVSVDLEQQEEGETDEC